MFLANLQLQATSVCAAVSLVAIEDQGTDLDSIDFSKLNIDKIVERYDALYGEVTNQGRQSEWR